MVKKVYLALLRVESLVIQLRRRMGDDGGVVQEARQRARAREEQPAGPHLWWLAFMYLLPSGYLCLGAYHGGGPMQNARVPYINWQHLTREVTEED